MFNDGYDSTRDEVFELARNGLVLPLCSECDIPLDFEYEVLSKKGCYCKSCGSFLDVNLIPWIFVEDLPKA